MTKIIPISAAIPSTPHEGTVFSFFNSLGRFVTHILGKVGSLFHSIFSKKAMIVTPGEPTDLSKKVTVVTLNLPDPLMRSVYLLTGMIKGIDGYAQGRLAPMNLLQEQNHSDRIDFIKKRLGNGLEKDFIEILNSKRHLTESDDQIISTLNQMIEDMPTLLRKHNLK